MGDYADYIDFKNQKVVRKVNKVDLGTLTYTFGKINTTYPYGYFVFSISDIANNKNEYVNEYYNAYCESYKKAGNFQTDKAFLRNVKSTSSYFIDSNYTDGELLKQSLNGRLFYYILNTPTEETIELPNILTGKGNNKVTIETKIQPSKIELTYYKAK